MFGYNLAAAHLGLRHTVAHSFAVSDPWAGGEGMPRLSVPVDVIILICVLYCDIFCERIFH